MTDEPPPPDETREPARKGFWSLQSDEESVARGQNNFWAMLETALAIIGFWYVALTCETFFPLITSLFVAPLLFLRSEAAVKQGVTWFQSGFFATAHSHEHGEWWANDARNVRPLMWLKNNVAITSSIFIALPAVWHSKTDQSLAPTLWGLALCYGLMGTTVALALILEYSEKGAGAYGVVHAITGELTTKTYSFSRVLWMQSFALGLYFYALVVRVRATFCHFSDGYRDMPANVRRLAFRVSPLHAPDLLPGLPEGKRWRFDEFFDWVKSELTSPSCSDKFLGINGLLMLAIWFAPGWAYRVVLGSRLITNS